MNYTVKAKFTSSKRRVFNLPSDDWRIEEEDEVEEFCKRALIARLGFEVEVPSKH